MKKTIIKFTFALLYRLKYILLKFILGNEARAHILYSAMYPEIVLLQGGASMGGNVRVGRYLTIHESKNDFSKLKIGNDVHIGKHVFIDLTERVNICDRAGIGMKSSLITHINLGDSSLTTTTPPISKPIIIGKDSVTNIGVTVLLGVSIGDKVICLPHSVISTDIPSRKVVGGNPQRILKNVE